MSNGELSRDLDFAWVICGMPLAQILPDDPFEVTDTKEVAARP